MRVRSFTDARMFGARIAPALLLRERENSLLLGIVKGLADRPNDRAVMVAVEESDRAVCAAVMTPPFNLILSTGPAGAVPLLAERLRAGDIILPGVMSTAEMADAVAAAWRRPEAGIFDTRLYSLDAPPPPGAARGVLRAAAAADIPLLRDWATAFFADVGLPSFEGEAFIARLEEMIAVPRLWLWDDDGPVCMVAHTETTPRTARIGPVYTPPGLRGKGYATAAVAALTRGLLAGGRTWCVLFADVANPTATELYRRLGYEEVCLFREYRLGP